MPRTGGDKTEVTKKKIVFHTDWFDIESERYENVPALAGKPVYRINVPDSVVILALTEESKAILVRQFRPASNRDTLELPAGGIDKSESAEEAAARELYEETGYRCRELRYVTAGHVVAERINSTVFVFFGRGAVKDEKFAPEAGIEVIPMSIDGLKQLTRSGEFQQLPGLGTALLVKWILGPGELADL